jgi:hypothetical protein
MLDTAEPLPANPTGFDQLQETVKAIRQPPLAEGVPALPETARLISGKTYTFDMSPLDIKTMRWEFNDSAEARLHATFYNQPDQDLLIGLDGIYRMYPIGEHVLNMGLRGRWIDAETFLFEYDGIANREAYALEIQFDGDRATIRAKERTHTAVLTLDGRTQNP